MTDAELAEYLAELAEIHHRLDPDLFPAPRPPTDNPKEETT